MEVGKVIRKLATLTDVDLPRDATDEGFGKINECLSAIGTNTMEATRVRLDVIAEMAAANKEKAKSRMIVDLKRADLQVNDKEVQEGKNDTHRKAIADVKLAKELSTATKSDIEYQHLQSVLDASRKVLEALKQHKELAGHLLNVVQKEMDLGLVTPATVGGVDPGHKVGRPR